MRWDKIAKKKKKKRVIPLLIVIMLLLLVIVIIAGLVKGEKQEITTNTKITGDSSEVLEPAQDIDLDKLMESYDYLTVESSQLNEGILVSGENTDTLTSGLLSPVYNALFDSNGLQIASEVSSRLKLRREVIEPLNSMLVDFYEEYNLRTIIVKSAYSPYQSDDEATYSDGNIYYDEYGNYIGYTDLSSSSESTVAENKNDCAEHSDGYSLDLGIYNESDDQIRNLVDNGVYSWFESNCFKYGFIIRYPEGKDEETDKNYNYEHYRYVGTAISQIMQQYNLCFEELTQFMRTHTYDNPIKVQTSDGCQVVYYVEDSQAENTAIQIPIGSNGEMQPYEISGDGKNGYIVIVKPTEEFDVTSSEQDDADNSNENSKQ